MPFVTLRMVYMTLKYGQGVNSAFAFASYGLLKIATGQIDEAYRFAQLAMRFLKEVEVKNYLPRVYVVVFGTVFIWKRPLRTSLEPLRQAHQVGLQTGTYLRTYNILQCLCQTNLLYLNVYSSFLLSFLVLPLLR